MKTVSKVVVYFTDGTYQEVGNTFNFGGGGLPAPYEPFPAEDAEPYKWPGKTGTWPTFPGGPTIVD